MKADISYEVRAVKFDGDSYGSTYTERTLWRILTVDGKAMGEGVPIAKFNNNKEADIFEAWVKEHTHIGHGSGEADSGPDDSDCPCRTTVKRSSCAQAGCGFCRVTA